uniref:beta strand repeat-containing protein n=1 Tax=Thioalkalivibrio sp. HK1 TaxID=1469245 RepID=UPI001E3268D5
MKGVEKKCVGKSILGSVGYGLVLVLFTLGLALPRMSAAEILINPGNNGSIGIVEGVLEQDTFHGIDVSLSNQPSSDVTVTLKVTNNINVNLSRTSVTFTSSNWRTRHRIKVTAPKDSDPDPDSANVYITASGGGYDSFAANINVDIADKDLILFSPSTLTMDEGKTAAIKVKLAASPGVGKETVARIAVRLDEGGRYARGFDINGASSPYYATLTFDSTNWNVEQDFRMSAREDDRNYTDDVYKISLYYYGSYSNSSIYVPLRSTMYITVVDNDRDLALSTTSLDIDEGSTNTFKVKLHTQPTAAVRVTLTQPSNTDVTVDKTTLDFTTTNWNTDQTVTVSAAADRGLTNESATIPLSASGGDYEGLSAQVTVNVRDMGDRLVFSHDRLDVIEGQWAGYPVGSGGIRVKLKERPSGDVTVSLQPNNSDLTLERSTLTFTTANWNSFQLAKFQAAEDADAANDDVTVTLTASGGGYEGVSEDVNILILDNDLVIFSPASLTMDEGGTAATPIKVKLALPPNPGDETIIYMQSLPKRHPSGGFGGEVRVNGDRTGNLTFDSTNWNVEQTVTVTSREEDHNYVDNQYDIQFVHFDYRGNAYSPLRVNANVTVLDNDRNLALSTTSLNIDEGSTSTFNVKLHSPPAETVRVTLAQPSNTDVTVDKTTLDFTTTNWATEQTVTVSVANDVDAMGESATISLSASGDGYDDITADVKVNVTDINDRMVLRYGTVWIVEGEASAQHPYFPWGLRVKLKERPSGDVTVTMQSNNSDLTFGRSTLTFTTGNWNSYQTVPIIAAEDDDPTDDEVIATFTASGGGFDNVRATANILIHDNDLVIFSPTSLVMTEDGTATVNVRLAESPGAGNERIVYAEAESGIDFHVLKDDGTRARTKPVTFNSTNWNVDQTVTLIGREDSNFTDDEENFRLSPTRRIFESGTGRDYGNQLYHHVKVTVKDSDKELVLSKESIDVDEGDTSTFGVKLVAQPTTDVRVTLAQPSNTDVTVDKTTLDFTATNWNTEQTVTVSTAVDSDTSNESATISFSASGGEYEGVSDSLKVDVRDTTGRLMLSTTDMAIDEGSAGAAAAYLLVRLTKRPSADVGVTVTQPSNTDVTVDKTSLTFTASNWNVNQTLRVSAAEDADVTNDSANIRLTASGGGYDNASTVSVEVMDNDKGSFVLPSATVALTEGGTATFDVRLMQQTTADVTVTLIQPSNPDITVDTDTATAGNQNTLTFTAANWSAAQSVTVNAAEDSDTDNETAGIAVSATGGGYNNATGSVSVNVTDDDTWTLVLPSSPVALIEGDTATFDVRLSAQPTANVTVNLTQPSNADVKLDTDTAAPGNQNTLTFTTANWNTNQSVRLSAAEDGDMADESASITLSSTGGGYDQITGTVSIDLTDDDEGDFTLPSAPVVLVEGATATFDVRLSVQPTSSVTVNLAQPSNTDVTLDTDTSTNGNQTTLAFTTSNWNTAQTVRLSAAEDGDSNNESASISVSATGGGYGDATGTVSVSVTDNDSGAALVLPTQAVALTEGETATFDVKLTQQPTANVTVTLAQPGNTDVKLDTDPGTNGEQNTLTFTAFNWNTTQSVRLSAADDGDADDESASISLSATGGGYNNASGTVSVNLTDDDAGTLTLPSGAVAIVEGATASFDVRLSAPPTANVTVTLEQPSNTDVKLDTDTFATGNQNTLTFTASNWNTARTVRLSAADDDDTDDENASIAVSATGGGYGDATGTVSVDVTDDDAGALTLPSSAVAVVEGNTTTFDVRLSAAPSANVTVTLAQPDNADVTLDTDTGTTGNQNTLVFTTSDWNTAQTVQVSAAEDGDADDDTASISVSATGGG